MVNAKWYFERSRKIPAAEYIHRLDHLIKKLSDKYLIRSYGLQADENSSIIKVSKGIGNINKIEEFFPGAKSHIIQNAENIHNNLFDVFGIQCNFGNPINWQLDPKTGNSWPIRFWGDIGYKRNDSLGGIKFAWEVNRFHQLPQLAIAFSLTGYSKYKEEIFAQIGSWMDLNPYPKGINWIMGIELGLRIVNVVYALKFLGDEPLNSSQQKLISEFISIHGRHIYRYPSKYSSCGNHAIAEALGLFVAGLCFPSLRDAGTWKTYGQKVLERETIRQIYPDGSNFEHSIPYLQFVLDHLLVYYILCKEYGEVPGGAVENRLKASFTFIAHILDKEGNYPAIGDGDDGYLLKLWFGNHNNFVSLLNTGAILFDCPDWILENSEFDQKTFFLLGDDAKIRWEKLKNKKKSVFFKSKYFKNAGLAVIKDENSSDLLFVGNSGPLGLKPLGGHGHADALSIWLSVDGKPILIDPGTYLYHGGGRWRNYFRSTSAHNTIRIDQHDQAEIVADFIFKRFYQIKNPEFTESTNMVLWSAGHDAYMRLDDPVFHRREAKYFNKEKKIVITDQTECKKSHLIECFFHFHPDVSIVKKNGIFEIKNGTASLRMIIDEKWEKHSIIKGQNNPIIGWYSPGFNKLMASSTMVLSAHIEGQKSFTSSIYLA